MKDKTNKNASNTKCKIREAQQLRSTQLNNELWFYVWLYLFLILDISIMIAYIQVALFKHLDSYLIFHLIDYELIPRNVYLEERLFAGGSIGF